MNAERFLRITVQYNTIKSIYNAHKVEKSNLRRDRSRSEKERNHCLRSTNTNNGCDVQTIRRLEVEEDINQITDFFSYEHFYVIYCKFWELDRDHDLLISKEDLSRHNDHGNYPQ